MKPMDMDISVPSEEDDDEAALAELLDSLSGIEKCFLPPNEQDMPVGNVILEHDNPNKSTSPEENEVSRRPEGHEIPNSVPVQVDEIQKDSDDSIVMVFPISPTASTLSRQSTPDVTPSRFQKDDDEIHILKICSMDRNSDSDVIIEPNDEARKNIDTVLSDHSNIAEIQSQVFKVVSLDKNFDSDVIIEQNDEVGKNMDTVLSDNSDIAEINVSLVAEKIDSQNKEDESSSDCDIIEHIQPSAHRLNGFIDLTENLSEEETSLLERTEESLLREIKEIRRALLKRKRKRKKRRKKKKKSRKSAAKSPSLEKISNSEFIPGVQCDAPLDINNYRRITSVIGHIQVNLETHSLQNEIQNSDDMDNRLERLHKNFDPISKWRNRSESVESMTSPKSIESTLKSNNYKKIYSRSSDSAESSRSKKFKKIINSTEDEIYRRTSQQDSDDEDTRYREIRSKSRRRSPSPISLGRRNDKYRRSRSRSYCRSPRRSLSRYQNQSRSVRRSSLRRRSRTRDRSKSRRRSGSRFTGESGRRSRSSHRSISRRRSSSVGRRRSSSKSSGNSVRARKCSPLEKMRQLLRKENESAVKSLLQVNTENKNIINADDTLKFSAPSRIIDDVDLTIQTSPINIDSGSGSSPIGVSSDMNANKLRSPALACSNFQSTNIHNTTTFHQTYSFCSDFTDPGVGLTFNPVVQNAAVFSQVNLYFQPPLQPQHPSLWPYPPYN